MTTEPGIRIKVLFKFIPLLLLLAQPGVITGEEVPLQRAHEELMSYDIIPASNNVNIHLRAVTTEMEVRGITRQNARELGASSLSNPLVQVSEEGRIQTYIHVSSFGEAEKALLEPYEVSIEIANEELGIIQAWVPFARIEEVARLPFVRQITPPSYGTLRKGSVTTEGDAILNADDLRALGFDGTGVKVGVISDGANNRADAAATGDLPFNITVYGTCNPATSGNTCNEGTAILEIIHDLAPGAELGMGDAAKNGLPTNLQFIQRVEDLQKNFGADIIVDDLGFFAEPYFEDGPVAKKVAEAVASGVIYVSAAGNDAKVHYQGQYVDSGDGKGSHQISPGNTSYNPDSVKADQ